jgi:hypothetical protein
LLAFCWVAPGEGLVWSFMKSCCEVPIARSPYAGAEQRPQGSGSIH